MEKSGCSGGRNVLTESAEERSAVVGVRRESTHELACVLTDLCERIKAWLLFWASALAAFATSVATRLVFLESAVAFCTDPLRSPTTAHQTHTR